MSEVKSHIGHDIEKKARTQDISHHEMLGFDDLLISQPILEGLKNAGFIHPSPIQLKAIPLGRCGLDLIIQAKSGTGKTCVFAVVSLESVTTTFSSLQVLILSPTREIAIQSQRVILSLGSRLKNLNCHTFIGGIHRSEDLKNIKNCHIAVGSPGRIKYLIEEGFMKTESIRLFVLDEVDMLMTDAFQPTINWIFSSLPTNKQVIAVSATYTESMVCHLSNYMKNPTFVRLNASDPALLGIRQFYHVVPYHHLQHVIFQSKLEILIKILSGVDFQQCLIFSNYHQRTQELCESLTQRGWPVSYISGSLGQAQRIQAYDQLTSFQCRVLVSTDVTSRGIDAENVNLVINLDVPWEHETYLHRIGRAGRFGSFGAAISLVSSGEELRLLQRHERNCRTSILNLPTEPIPKDLALPQCPALDVEKLVSVQQLGGPAPEASHAVENGGAVRSTPARRPHSEAPRRRAAQRAARAAEAAPEAAAEESLVTLIQLRSSLREVRSRAPLPTPAPLPSTPEELSQLLSDLQLQEELPKSPAGGDLWEKGLYHCEELSAAVRRHLELRRQPASGATARPDTREIGLQTAAPRREAPESETLKKEIPVMPSTAEVEAAEEDEEEEEAREQEDEEYEEYEEYEEDEEEEEEEGEEEEEEMAALQNEYNRLWYWAQFFSGEYERACKKHESLLETLTNFDLRPEYDTQCADDEAEDEEDESCSE